jgi:hypothetical protein
MFLCIICIQPAGAASGDGIRRAWNDLPLENGMSARFIKFFTQR